MPIVVVAGGIVILAGDVISNLFGANRAADFPRPAALAPLSDGPGTLGMVIALVLILMIVLVIVLAARVPGTRKRSYRGSQCRDRQNGCLHRRFQPAAIQADETTSSRKGAGPE